MSHSNIYRWLPMIKLEGAIVQSYGGDRKEPWMSPYDIAHTISEEMAKPFTGKTVHYIASNEVSPNEIPQTLGKAMGYASLELKSMV